MTDLIEIDPVDLSTAMRAFSQAEVRSNAEVTQLGNSHSLDEEVVRLRDLVCQLLVKNERLRQRLADQPQTTFGAGCTPAG